MSDFKMYYRANEAKEYLGVGLSTIWQLVREGKLKAYKASKQITLFSKEDLDNFARGL